MTYDLADVLREGVSRLLAPVTAVFVVVYAVFGLLSTGAVQGLFLLGTERWLQSFVERELGTFIEEIRQDDPQAAEDLERTRQEIIDQGLAEWLSEFAPYAITNGWEVAGLVFVIAVFGILVVTVLAYTAYGTDIGSPDRQLFDRILWKTANAFGVGVIGTLVMGGSLAAALALWFVHPLVAVFGVLVWLPLSVVFAVVALYAPAAVAIDGDNVISAFLRSFSIAKSNVLATVALLGIWFLLSFAVGSGVGTVIGQLPAIVSTPLQELVSAATSITLIAFVGTAYAASEQSDAGEFADEEPPSAVGQDSQQPQRGAGPGQNQPPGDPSGQDQQPSGPSGQGQPPGDPSGQNQPPGGSPGDPDSGTDRETEDSSSDPGGGPMGPVDTEGDDSDGEGRD